MHDGTEKLSLRAKKLISATLVCGVIAVFISVGLQGIDAFGLPLSELKQPRVWADGFATSYGITASLAAVALLLGSIALRTTMGRWLAACALIGAGMTLAASGHTGPERVCQKNSDPPRTPARRICAINTGA